MPSLDNLTVVLVATRNPLNIGAAARAMSNFGFTSLRVVRPYEPAFREARSAVGASDLLAKAEMFKTVPEAIADCSLVVGTTAVGKRALQHSLRRLETGAAQIHKRLAKNRVALLFGSEKTGLTNQDMSHCHWLIRIPTTERTKSMNLGQAVAVCLYELIRDAKSPRKSEKIELATAVELERITSILLDALKISGFLDLRPVSYADERIRRAIRRLHLPARDAVIWQGMLRQILWKLRNPEKPLPLK